MVEITRPYIESPSPAQGRCSRLSVTSSRFPGRRASGRRGTSLVEVLVVIVVFLIGILAVIQIFPGGLKLLSQTRDRSMATFLAHDEMERLKGRNDQLPEMIVPVQYSFAPGLQISVDTTRNPDNLAPLDGDIQDTGIIQRPGGDLGPWQLMSGANTMRRVIGESAKISAPRQIGNYYGSLMVLQFGPTYHGALNSEITAYGEDLNRIQGEAADQDLKPHEYFVGGNEATPTLYLPAPNPLTAAVGEQWQYNIRLSAYVNEGGNIVRRDFVGLQTVIVDINANLYEEIPIAASLPAVLPEKKVEISNIVAVDVESIRVARKFKEISLTANFSATDPYEFKIFDPELGLLLFNNIGYSFYAPRPGGKREKLVAKVDYDVLDWRIIRDEFRVATTDAPQYKLALRALKIMNDDDVDRSQYKGMGFDVLDSAAGTAGWRDFVLMDLETGGILSYPDSYSIDKSSGLIRFIDIDANDANGIQANIILRDPRPGGGPTIIKPVRITGRSLRALYQARGEWAVQVLKAAPRYSPTDGTPGLASYFVGDGTPGRGVATRIYFPWMDVGRRVTIEQIYFWKTGDSMIGEPRPLKNQSFVIQAPGVSGDPMYLPYIDVSSVEPDMVRFDTERYGYAVDGVEGASLTVRVLWNTSGLLYQPDPAQNRAVYERWAREYHRMNTESFFQKGDGK